VFAASGLYTHVVTGRCQGNGQSPHGYINQRLQTQFTAPDDERFAVVTGRCLGNGQSPRGYINQRLQTQFRAPDDEQCAARNMSSLQ